MGVRISSVAPIFSCSSMVEQIPVKDTVVGSSPIGRAIWNRGRVAMQAPAKRQHVGANPAGSSN